MTETPKPPKKRRGRPKLTAAEIEDMRSEIKRCAKILFQKEGYPAVSMRRLAQEAGITVMTLYKYFERKIDILRALWQTIFEELFSELEAGASHIEDAGERLKFLANGYVNYWLDHREHYFMVFMSSGIEQSDVSIFVEDDAILARFAMVSDALSLALPEGADDQIVKLKMDVLICGLHGIAHNLITISSYPWAEPGTLVDEVVNNALRVS